ncbi:MAG TPA: hypothetical protein VF267_05535 [Gammaproteobacteria bacterium]
MKKSGKPRLVGQTLHVAGILVSLATFILHAIPASWGIFLTAACFIVGSVFWPGWDTTDGKNS